MEVEFCIHPEDLISNQHGGLCQQKNTCIQIQGVQNHFLCKEMLISLFNFEVTQKSLNMGRFDNYTFENC